VLLLLLDHHVPIDVAKGLRAKGYDVTTALWEKLYFRVDDPDVWEAAIRMNRAVVTYNIKDFAPIYGDWYLNGKHHPGLILVSSKSIRSNDCGTLIRALENLLQLTDSLDNQMIHLADFKDI
jgi:predicted nuclease of predicted toxin-antitoxin system